MTNVNVFTKNKPYSDRNSIIYLFSLNKVDDYPYDFEQVQVLFGKSLLPEYQFLDSLPFLINARFYA